MKQILALFISMLLLQSCSTTIMTKDKFDGFKLSLDENLKRSKISVRAFSWSDWELKEVKTKVISNEQFSKIVKETISEENGFKKVIFNNFEVDEYNFEKSQMDDNSKIRNFLMEDILKSKSDYFLDVYTYYHMKGYHHPYLEFFWALIHAGSLGLVPYWSPETIEIRADLYDSTGKLVKSTSIKNDASKWTWSPNVFRKDAKKLYDEDFSNRISKNTLSKVLQETFAK